MNPWKMSGKSHSSQAISMQICLSSDNLQTYLKPISGKYQANRREVSGYIAQTYLRKILGIFQIAGKSQAYLRQTKENLSHFSVISEAHLGS